MDVALVREFKDFNFRVDGFTLKQLNPSDYFVKEPKLWKIEFKNVPASHLVESIRAYQGEELPEAHRYFLWMGKSHF